ncbi:hypothetical protein VKT23_007645 [Stygiomarasmius scandens]|uniref:UDP-Glycosyltransferase/glycogen phosphorylase n=1 Tax=Marasmiellus scandens TaxID=2682957 RepID=A0ABR1JKF1_9AGAR
MTIPTVSLDEKNIFFWAVPAWGHTKPIASFGLHILESRPNIFVTVFTHASIYPKLVDEIDRISGKAKIERDDITKRFVVIDACGNSDPFYPSPNVQLSFEKLWNGESLECLSSGKVFANLPRPVVAVVDPSQGYVFEAVREVTLPSGRIPIFSWMTATIGACLYYFGPKSLGGIGPSGLLDMKMIKGFTEEDKVRFGDPTLGQLTGKLVEIPGVPTMYDYEYRSQEINVQGFFIEESGRIYIPECDGMFSVTSSAIEGEAINTWNRWFESIGQVHYPIGPLAVPKAGLYGANEHENDETHVPVVDFLDRMQEKYGEQCVIYISFGSWLWPVESAKVWAMVEEFLQSDIPVILAYPGLPSSADEEKLNLIRDSPIGLDLKWAPQETILSHPATGWFVAHGGWNGTQEALRYKVPQIFWPFAGDQAYNAALLTRTHKAGFELFSIRSGAKGTQIPYVFQISGQPIPTFTVEAVREEIRKLVVRMKGEEGKEARRNLARVADEYLKGWDEDGVARRGMEEFLRKFVDSDGKGKI